MRRIWTFVLASLLAIGLTACNQAQSGISSDVSQAELSSSSTDEWQASQQAEPSDSQQAAPERSLQAESQDSSQSESQTSPEGEVQSEGQGLRSAEAAYGNPWISALFSGNLPENAPKATDDLYLHYAYGYIAAHQDDDMSSVMGDSQRELREAVTTIIKGATSKSPELEQLRMFYEQAADTETLAATGADELWPYLQTVANTQSLDELESVLLSYDFPFSPWIDTTVSAPDMKSSMCVAITPYMLFSDEETDTEIYRDSDDPTTQTAHFQARFQKTIEAETGIVKLSIRDNDYQAQELCARLFELEKAYGKDTNQVSSLEAGYGAQAESKKTLTLEQLEVACPNFPMRQTLAKFGEDSDDVVVTHPEWLASFNDVWTDENFEYLRAMTELKVLAECKDFIDPTFFADAWARLGTDEPTADDTAWAACDRADTFAQLLAKTYVEQALDKQAADKLETLTDDLLDAYVDLIGTTSWLDAQSRENALDKIDTMVLNILYPDGGYLDYNGLELVPTEQGGTLFGNYLNLKAYNDHLEAELVGQPARASSSWLRLRPTQQSCFYDPMNNSINVFPGFVTSALYKDQMKPEELLAGMGFAIAREMSHAFDYSWSQFDAYGRPSPIFTNEDAREFAALQQKLADRYAAIEVAPGKNFDGATVSTEAMADLSGMQAICERARALDRFDYKKMFGQLAATWAIVYPPSYVDALMLSPYALSNARINVSAQMMDAFYEAYGVSKGNAMYLAPDKRILIWGKNAG